MAATGGVIYFGVDATFIAGPAASYTIDIEHLHVADMHVRLPLTDSSAQRTASAYAVPVTPGVTYTVSITGLNDDADLYVFGNDGTFSSQAACLANYDNRGTDGTGPEDCTLTSSADREYVIVDGIFSSTNTVNYTVLVSPTPAIGNPVNEGSLQTPRERVLGVPADGQAGFAGTSYYVVNGLTAGARYTVSITGLSADGDLSVWNDGAFTAPANCLIDNLNVVGNAPEACTLQSAGTTISFSVSAFTTSGGIAFTSLVAPGP